MARKSAPSRGTNTGSRLPLAECDSLPETAYLLRKTANAHRLIDGIEEAEAEIRRRRRARKKA